MKYKLTNPFVALRRLGWLLLFMFAFNPNVHAQSIELCTTLDGSESIVSSDFQLQLEGLAQAVRNPTVVPQDGSVTLSIVHFATEARVEVAPIQVTSAAVAAEIATTVLNIKQSGLGEFTGIAQAIDLCAEQFSYADDSVQLIDIVTDGEHNQEGDPVESANNAVEKGVDVINALGVGMELDEAKLRAMVRPQPASSDLSDLGFFLQISSYEQFTSAIQAKISAETGQSGQFNYPSSMVSLGGGLCLAVADDALQAQTCNGNPNQQWALVGNQFQNAAGQCLTSATSGDNGADISVAECNGASNQAWTLTGSQLKNGLGQCLDLAISDLNTSGSRVQVWECTGDLNQNWKLSGTPLRNTGSQRCLDIPNWNANGNIVHTWDCHAEQNQRWTLNNTALVNDYSRCLDVHAPDMNNNGGQVQIWDCLDDTANQQWTLNDRSELVNASGKCLDVDASQLDENAAKVQVWDCNGQDNQKWQFFFVNRYTGMLNGMVKDSASLVGLSDVNIDVMAGDLLTSNAMTSDDGSYMVANVPTKQEVTAEFSKDGYMTATYNEINIDLGNSLDLDQVLLIPNEYAGRGTMTGMAVNGVTGGGLEEVSLRLRSGMNTKSGDVVAETVSAADGTYQLQANGGNYTLEASKVGFVTSYANVVVLGEQTKGNQNVTLVPILGSGEVRAVLTWGKNPLDLDSHATGPLASGDRFHVFWERGQLGSLDSSPFAQLDVDDIFSYEPETITFAQTNLAGVYRYSVHDYSNRKASKSKGLANSGAKVSIYNEYGLIATLNVPNQTGTLWTVFEIREGQLRIVDEMSNESDSRSIRHDTANAETDQDVINQNSSK